MPKNRYYCQLFFILFSCICIFQPINIFAGSNLSSRRSAVSERNIKRCVTQYIQDEIKDGNGYFVYRDDKQKITWKLVFIKLQKKVRFLKNNIYSTIGLFKTNEKKSRKVEIDVLMKKESDALVPYKTKLYSLDGKQCYVYSDEIKKEKPKTIKTKQPAQTPAAEKPIGYTSEAIMKTYEWETELDKGGIQSPDNIDVDDAAGGGCPT